MHGIRWYRADNTIGLLSSDDEMRESMDEYEKVENQILDEFFRDIPELIPIRDIVQSQIRISIPILFFGYILVLLAKACSKLMKDSNKVTRAASEKLLHAILSFLDDCLESEDNNSIQSNNAQTLLDLIKVQAAVYFTENLYNAGDEYQRIVDLAPHRLKTEITRVEKYYGIPKPSTYEIYKVLYHALREILR
jgi:hypothetical protein